MARHPAHDRRTLVNGDGVPEQGGEAGGGEPGGAGTDHGDALAGGGQGNEAGFMPGIGGKPLQRMDGDGLVVFRPVAFGFARVRAHAPGDAGEGVARVQPGEGLVGFSGGEKKKAEILQLLMLKPALALLDETDSGLDVDAVKTVANGIKAYHNDTNALIIITHNAKILEGLQVDYVHVLDDARIVRTGNGELVSEIIEEGFAALKEDEAK